jgi:hypothetical protein
MCVSYTPLSLPATRLRRPRPAPDEPHAATPKMLQVAPHVALGLPARLSAAANALELSNRRMLPVSG